MWINSELSVSDEITQKTQNRHGYQNVTIRKPRSEAMISTDCYCFKHDSANVYFRVRFKVDGLTRLVESERLQVGGRSVQKYMVISHMDGHTRVYCLEPNRIKCILFDVSDLFQRGRSLDSNEMSLIVMSRRRIMDAHAVSQKTEVDNAKF